MKKSFDFSKIIVRVGFIFAILGAAAIIYGIERGEWAVVFAKSAKICMECIGID